MNFYTFTVERQAFVAARISESSHMAHSYIAYIDESGDDGLSGNYRQQGVRGGSSIWLTISAAVWRSSLDANALAWRDEIRSRLGVQAQKRPLHYKCLNHSQRIMAAQVLANKPFRSICVMSYKPLIVEKTYNERNKLYYPHVTVCPGAAFLAVSRHARTSS